jgi:hypothetical protein
MSEKSEQTEVVKIRKDLELPLLDHIIVCESENVSLRSLQRWPS